MNIQLTPRKLSAESNLSSLSLSLSLSPSSPL